MTTDTNDLISGHLAWRQREMAYNADFDIGGDDIVAVIDGKTPELATQAATSLAARLEAQPALFRAVEQPDGGEFWAHNGLLYLSTADVKSNIDHLIAAQPFLGPLASDPSLRGLMGSLSTALSGVTSGQAKLADIRRPIHALANSLDDLEQGKPAFFSWQTTISGKPAEPRDLRHIILIKARLDYRHLEAGREATGAIRTAAHALKLDPAHGVTVRLTGDSPLQDQEFATLTEHIGWIATLAVSAILLMLWFAVKSARVIACILATTLIGLVSAACLGLLVFGTFTVISVAFIPLFVGLGIDFGIQFSVRFRAEHVGERPIEEALTASGLGMGRSLTLAATAIACGFLAFAPTDYHAVSQLGVIAGMGMFIALLLNLTVLPALLRLSRPSGRHEELGYSRLERLDSFMLRNRRLVVGAGVLAAVICAALMPLLHFDFNPIHLRSPKVESVAALLDLMKDPNTTPNSLEVLRPNLAAADRLAVQLAQLPEVHQTRTLSSFVPADQPAKLAMIDDAATLMDISLNPFMVQPQPSDAEVVQGLNQTAADLRSAAAGARGPDAADALRLANDLDRLAKGPASLREKASNMLIPGLNVVFDELRS
ncbi:MAG TPA: MMPL family transporter, partial [Caulobacteraceae bacterium]|nr:MMPL family transporter [Caulobacteraceae bacterium]